MSPASARRGVGREACVFAFLPILSARFLDAELAVRYSSFLSDSFAYAGLRPLDKFVCGQVGCSRSASQWRLQGSRSSLHFLEPWHAAQRLSALVIAEHVSLTIG